MVHPDIRVGAETVLMIPLSPLSNAPLLRLEHKTVAAIAPLAARYG